MRKTIITLGTVLLLNPIIHAQLTSTPASFTTIPKVVAPNIDADALGVFDKQSINLSTGTPNIEVLLHTIHIGDLEFPIKLRYDASGIKVGQVATSVGLGWSITNSGILTQEVKDRVDGPSSTNIIQQYLNTPTVAGRHNIIYNHQNNNQPYVGNDLETDNYNVNYFGNTIPFFLNYNNNTYIPQQKDGTKIVKETNVNKWTVILNDGTELSFNEQFAVKSTNVSTTYLSNPVANQAENGPVLNDSWYLTNIKSKGQTATLQYVNSANNYASKGSENEIKVTVVENIERFKLIKEINTLYEKVIFEYSPEREDLSAPNKKPDLLKFIKVYNNGGKLIKQFQLYYDYYIEAGPLPQYAGQIEIRYKYKRLRLKEIKKLDIGTLNDVVQTYQNHYSFIYNSDTLPNRFSTAQDIWGYYNGKTSNNVDFMFPRANTPASNILVDPNYSGIGLLTKVIYPTGGSTEYFYENNVSLKPINYELMHPKAIAPGNSNEIFVGGQRVKKMVTNDGVNSYTQEFVYTHENGTSSGSIIALPFVANVNQLGPIFSQSSNPLSKLRGQNLVYKRVERLEKDSNGLLNGKTVQYFNGAIMNNRFNKSPFPPPDEKSHTYGQLNKEEMFEFKNGVFNKVQENNYFYTYPEKCDPDTPTDNCSTILKGLSYSDVIGWPTNGSSLETDFNWGLYNLEASPFKLVRKMSKMYHGSNIITTSEDMNYASSMHNNLTSKLTTFSDQTIQETSYKYAHEKGNSLLTDKNMIGIPLETLVTKTIGNVSKTLSRTETIYPKTLGEITNNASLIVLPISSVSYNLQDNSRITEVEFDRFDGYGNLQQYTTMESVPTAIIWGYGNTQPIAKVENAKYSDIESLASAIVIASDLDGASGLNNDETEFLAALRIFREALPNHQVTTYTHDPLRGVRSITPPSGIRENYLYDTFNRLKEIKDDKGKKLKEFNYHYKN